MLDRPRAKLHGARLARPARRRVAVAFAALAGVAATVGIILGTGLSGTSAGAGRPAKSAGAATVQRRDLVQTDTEPGTLSYARPHTVFNRLSGTVTSLPGVGQTIKPGQTLYTVDGLPAVLMTGSVPAYRTLTAGVTNGADVQELEQNLVSLGFDPSRQIVIDQTFDAATTAAVDRWQASLGQTQTGTVTLGRIVFLPGAQRVTAVDTTLGSTGGSGSAGASSGGTSTGASTTFARARPVFVSLTTTTTSSTTTTTSSDTTTTARKPSGGQPGKSGSGSPPTSMAALLALLKAETAELAKLRATSGAAGATGGSGSTGSRSSAAGAAGVAGGASKSSGAGASGSASGAGASGSSGTASTSGASATAQAILQTTSTNLVVTVALDATKQSEAVLGAPVTVQMPDGTTVDGTITAVSPVAQTSSSSSSSSSGSGAGSGSASTPSATVPITITLRGSRHVSGLDQAAVSVNFQQQKAKNVLSVPVSALLATAGGGYAVQEVVSPHSLIPVTPGLFAAGYVQISGAQISSGLQVTDSQG